MSTLTGQQIKDTYEGLLKLTDSTTGITSTYQQIQDGLGNDTNTRISTSGIISPNVVGMNNQIFKPDFGGNGFNSGIGAANIAGIQNRVMYLPFYDAGIHSYSAVSYNLGTLTSTSDIVTWGLYTAQMTSFGLAPKDVIVSGVGLTSAGSTGVKTTALPSTITFSGTGGGFYFAAWYVSNAGVTPTVRYGSANANIANQAYAYNVGFMLNGAGTGSSIGQRYGTFANLQNVLNLPFQASYTESDITTNYVTTIVTQPNWGFGLNVIK